MVNRVWAVICYAFAIFILCSFHGSNAEALEIDLEPINFTFVPEYPVEGEIIQISFEVVNNGDEPATDVSIIVWNSTSECDNDDECIPIFESTEPVIDQSKSILVEFDCDSEGIDGCGGLGTKVITVFIDNDEEIAETNEDNNKIVHEYTTYSDSLADLRHVEGTDVGTNIGVIFTPEFPAVGDTVDILILYENSGGDSCTDFWIEFIERINDEEGQIAEIKVETLIGPDSPAQYNITWIPSQEGLYEIDIILDSNDNVEEYNEDDNSRTYEINIRPHTPELTLDESANISFDPLDLWLDNIYTNHTVNLSTVVLNEDYVTSAPLVRIGYYDLPENGTEELIGFSYIENLVNATRSGEEIVASSKYANITWTPSKGTNISGNHTIIVRIDPLNEIDEWDEDDNNFSFQLVILESKPDINVYDLFVSNNPVRGMPSEITFSLFNEGADYVSNYPIELRIEGDLIDSWDITLNQGSYLNLSFDYIWQSQQPSISVRADPANIFDELDESNNVNSLLINVAAPEYDFTIVSVKANDPVFKGDHIKLDLEIRNNLAQVPLLSFSLYVDNSTTPEFQFYDFEGNPIYYHSEENLAYNETRNVSIYWKSTTTPGKFNLTILGEVEDSAFVDLNQTDNRINITVEVKPRNYQLSVEMRNLPKEIYLNQTIEIVVSALNFGPEICCECPIDVTNMTNSDNCNGAEISLYIDGELFEIYQTAPLGRVNGEEKRSFFWTPTEPGEYLLEAIIDPDNIIDEFDESDNMNSATINVTIEEYEEEVIELVDDEEDPLISNPLVWAPLIGLSLAGIGMFIYNRLGDSGDYFDSYDPGTNAGDNLSSQQSGFRYNPETGETIDVRTGEIIGQDGKEKD